MNQMMNVEDEVDYSMCNLEQYGYRQLQQLAKSLKLPSNVKKVYLVQLIHAKKYLRQEDVDSIIQIVRMERQQLVSSNRRKVSQKRPAPMQNREISSTNHSRMSPPIHSTPKRTRRHYNNESSLGEHPDLSPVPIHSPKNDSGRVLRSTNVKTYKKSNCTLLDGDYVYGVIAARKTDDPNEPLSIVRSRQPKVNSDARWPIRSHGLSLLNCSRSNNDEKSVVARSTISCPKPQARLSSIYLSNNKEKATNYGMHSVVGFKRTDKKISKINAPVHKAPVLVQKTTELVQKTRNVYKQKCMKPQASFSNVDITVQDIINSGIDAKTIANSLSNYIMAEASINYPNMSTVTEMLPDSIATISKERNTCSTVSNVFPVYQHKKIRAGQKFTSLVASGNDIIDGPMQRSLPNFNDAFKKFKDLSKPLYVDVGEEPHYVHVPPESRRCVPEAPTIKLETLYTFKRECLEGGALPCVPTTCTTRCVNTAPTSVTAVIQPTTAHSDQYQLASYNDYEEKEELQSETETIARVENALRQIEYDLQSYGTAHSTPSSWDSNSAITSATIPELWEDAFEYISQDGDYMERIAMDERMSCIFCFWAGPRFMLDYHIKKEHEDQIVKQSKNTWNTTIKLSSLVNQEVWLSHVAEFESILYVLSLKYEDPDCFMVSLTNLTSFQVTKTGRITVYNKVTGEPYSWTGNIQELPTAMPYENQEPGLKLELSRLELLPNSANLKLVNRELILMSPSRTVVGKPELDDIHIIVFVNIFDDEHS